MSEKVDALIKAQGFEGYGRWNRLLEIVAFKMDKTDRCHCEYSNSKWCELLNFGKRTDMLHIFFAYTVDIFGINAVFNDNMVYIKIPNLLKKRDEYSKKSGQKPESVRTVDTDTDKRIKIKKNIKKKVAPLIPFGGEEQWSKFWTAYPRHHAKQEAIKAWNQLEPDIEMVIVIMTALDKQKVSEQWKKDGGQFIPLPATWLRGRRWEDESSERKKEQVWKNGRWEWE